MKQRLERHFNKSLRTGHRPLPNCGFHDLRTVCTAVSAKSECQPLVGQDRRRQRLQINAWVAHGGFKQQVNDRSPFRPVLAGSCSPPSIAQRNRLGSRGGIGRAQDGFPPLLNLGGGITTFPLVTIRGLIGFATRSPGSSKMGCPRGVP